MSQERHEFQAEVRQILKLVIHSLYTHKEIFLRELISNASDAIDKRRIQALTDPDKAPPEGKYRIVLEADPGRRTLSVSDNGVGMDRDELVSNLGTIARSGTAEFLSKLREAQGRADMEHDITARSLASSSARGQAVPELIGQFGVGFYSAFMAADRVSVLARKAGFERAWRWESDGEGSFTVEEAERPEPGTTVILQLKKPAEGEPDFSDPALVKGLVKKHSDFVAHPIVMAAGAARLRSTSSPRGPWLPIAPGAAEIETLNSMTPLWHVPAKEITPEQHAEFYRRLARDSGEALASIRFSAEGASIRYDALLYIPSKAPLEWLMNPEKRGGVKLYSKRVLVMEDCRELLSDFLRFVRGVVDCPDVPLNISRELLQHNRELGSIRERVTRKTLEALKSLQENGREKYLRFWNEFGRILKEGIYTESAERDRLKDLLLFETTKEPGTLSTFKDYVSRMPESQAEIFYIVGESRPAIESSPHLEALKEKGWEVILFTDPIDDFIAERIADYEGKPLRSARESAAAAPKERASLLSLIQEKLGGQAAEVRFSRKMTQSPSCLVLEGGVNPHLAGVMRRAGHPVPEARRILELNPKHPVVEKLAALAEGNKDDPLIADYAHLLYGLAALREGAALPDGAKFSKLVSDLMAKG